MDNRWKRLICWLFGHDCGYVVMQPRGHLGERTILGPCFRCGEDFEIPPGEWEWIFPDDLRLNPWMYDLPRASHRSIKQWESEQPWGRDLSIGARKEREHGD